MSIMDITWADVPAIYGLAFSSPIFWGIMGVAIVGALITWRCDRKGGAK